MRCCLVCGAPLEQRSTEHKQSFASRQSCGRGTTCGSMLGPWTKAAKLRGVSLGEFMAITGRGHQHAPPPPPEPAIPASRPTALDPYRAKWHAALFPTPDLNAGASKSANCKLASRQAPRMIW